MFEDKGHRPHARHTGETPRNEIKEAPYHLTVTLDTWGPVENLFPTLYDMLQANWGDVPMRAAERPIGVPIADYVLPVMRENETMRQTHNRITTGWDRLTVGEQGYVDSCFAGKTLPQALELISFSFLIDGCTRASTHQIVRARMGLPGFMQHGGRDNDWRHRPWVMPETIRRACDAFVHVNDELGFRPFTDGSGMDHCIYNPKAIANLIENWENPDTDPLDLRGAIEWYLSLGRELYAALVDAGIPWEDARRLLWMGTATYIHFMGNYRAVDAFLTQRLEHVMDWEINCIAQLMLREIKMKCPPVFSKYLGSASDKAGKAVFAGLESWPPDGKYPNPFERCIRKVYDDDQDGRLVVCGKEKSHPIHSEYSSGNYTGSMGYHPYEGEDSLPREHRPVQNPFWVLHPDSLNGGPIHWIPTNGTYPHDQIKGLS